MNIYFGTTYEETFQMSIWGKEMDIIVRFVTLKKHDEAGLRQIVEEQAPGMMDMLRQANERQTDVFQAIYDGVDQSEKPADIVAVQIKEIEEGVFEQSFYVSSKAEEYCYHVYLDGNGGFVCNSIS